MREQWLQEQAAAQTRPVDESWPQPEPSGWDIVDVSNFDVKEGSTQSFERAELETSGLMLVNRWHYLPSDFTDDRFENGEELVSIMSQSGTDGYSIQTSSRRVRLQQKAYAHLFKMISGAKEAGLENYLIEKLS